MVKYHFATSAVPLLLLPDPVYEAKQTVVDRANRWCLPVGLEFEMSDQGEARVGRYSIARVQWRDCEDHVLTNAAGTDEQSHHVDSGCPGGTICAAHLDDVHLIETGLIERHFHTVCMGFSPTVITLDDACIRGICLAQIAGWIFEPRFCLDTTSLD